MSNVHVRRLSKDRLRDRHLSLSRSQPFCVHPICVSFFAQGIFFAADLSVHVAASSFLPALVGADDISRKGHLRWDFV